MTSLGYKKSLTSVKKGLKKRLKELLKEWLKEWLKERLKERLKKWLKKRSNQRLKKTPVERRAESASTINPNEHDRLRLSDDVHLNYSLESGFQTNRDR